MNSNQIIENKIGDMIILLTNIIAGFATNKVIRKMEKAAEEDPDKKRAVEDLYMSAQEFKRYYDELMEKDPDNIILKMPHIQKHGQSIRKNPNYEKDKERILKSRNKK